MAQQNHAERGHATWSASSTDRNVNCPGALALTKDLPETTNEAADWGTCCHELSEMCLEQGKDAVDFLGMTLKGKEHENEVDDEMAETAQMYVDYVRQRYAEAGEGAVLLIEQKFSLAKLGTPFDAGGTDDALIYAPIIRNIEVIDLKGGRGVVVAAKGNPQLRTYALGAMLEHPEWPVDTITVTIVQPRAGHPDGRIRSETFHVADLIEWTQDLLAAMQSSAKALAEYEQIDEIGAFCEWAGAWLEAGPHCKFCKATATCPALEKKAYETAGVWFDDLGKPSIAIQAASLTPEQLAVKLDLLDMLGDWINAVRAHAQREAEGGVVIPGHILVEKVGNRAWTIDADLVAAKLKELGVAEPYSKKIMTPAQADKALGAKKKAAIEGINARPVRGTNLVRSDKTTRPAVASSAERHFDVLG